MLNINDRPDNAIGEPIFQPLLTGDALQGQDLVDWEAFCVALVSNNEPFYNTWMENRYRRMEQPRDKCAVKAEAHGNALIIRCPSRVWARLMRENVGPEIRKLTHRPLFILGPGEAKPKAATRGDILDAIAICEKMAARPDEQVQHIGPRSWNALARVGRTMLARHDKATGKTA